MQKAIIHTETRVIRQLTTDEDPKIQKDESVVDLAEKIDIGGGYWKLDLQDKKVAATDQEIDEAGVDPVKEAAKLDEKQKQIHASIVDMADNGVTDQKLQNYFTLLK